MVPDSSRFVFGGNGARPRNGALAPEILPIPDPRPRRNCAENHEIAIPRKSRKGALAPEKGLHSAALPFHAKKNGKWQRGVHLAQAHLVTHHRQGLSHF